MSVETLQSLEELESADLLRDSAPTVQADRDVRITLAEDWRAGDREDLRVVKLMWNVGGTNGKDTVVLLHPGKSVVQPLYKAMAWFGPFGLLLEARYADTEKQKQFLKEKYAAEKMRCLLRYDYPRPLSREKHGVEPVGPHRFPDVTVGIRNEDGTEFEPIRLHKLYKIGEFDEIYPLDGFVPKESIEEIKARYESEFDQAGARYEREVADMRRQMAEMAGMLQGFVAGKETKAK